MRHRRVIAMTLIALTGPVLTGCSSDKPHVKVSCGAGVNPKPARNVSWSTIYANIYNASGTSGAGASAAQHLKWRGLNVLQVGNDPDSGSRPAPTYAEIRYGTAGHTIALNVASQIPHATLYQDSRTDPTIDIVLGPKFALQPQPPAPVKNVKVHVYNTTFKPGLAQVVSNELSAQGFSSDARSNDKAYYPNDTAVIVYDEQGLPQAQRLAMSIKGARLVTDTQANVKISGTDVSLYLGSKWLDGGQVIPLSSATASPSTTPMPTCQTSTN